MTDKEQNFLEIDSIEVANGTKSRGGMEVEETDVGAVSGGGKKAGEASAKLGLAGQSGDDGGGGGWRMTTRGQKKGRQASKIVQLDSQGQLTFAFGEIPTQVKKRKADSVLPFAKKPTTESQQEQIIQHLINIEASNQELHKELKSFKQENAGLKAEVQALQAKFLRLESMISQENMRNNQSYSAAAQKGLPTKGPPKTQNRANTPLLPASGAVAPANKIAPDEENVVPILVSRVKEDLHDLQNVRDILNESMGSFKVMEGTQVQLIRLRLGERMDLIFPTAAAAAKAKQYPEWLTKAFPNARFKSDTWYPIKCDGVAKQAVLMPNSYAIKDTVLTDFKYNNSTDSIDCTAMKAKWISRPNAKNVGSLIIWLKKRGVVEKLLEAGNVVFGATQAYCSQYQHQESNLCFNCNTYGHRQNNCRRGPKCGICSGTHNTKACTRPDQPKCPACVGPHTVFNKACPLHPRHIRQSNRVVASANALATSTGTTTPATQRANQTQTKVAIPRLHERSSCMSEATSGPSTSSMLTGSTVVEEDVSMVDSNTTSSC